MSEEISVARGCVKISKLYGEDGQMPEITLKKKPGDGKIGRYDVLIKAPDGSWFKNFSTGVIVCNGASWFEGNTSYRCYSFTANKKSIESIRGGFPLELDMSNPACAAQVDKLICLTHSNLDGFMEFMEATDAILDDLIEEFEIPATVKNKTVNSYLVTQYKDKKTGKFVDLEHPSVRLNGSTIRPGMKGRDVGKYEGRCGFLTRKGRFIPTIYDLETKLFTGKTVPYKLGKKKTRFPDCESITKVITPWSMVICEFSIEINTSGYGISKKASTSKIFVIPGPENLVDKEAGAMASDALGDISFAAFKKKAPAVEESSNADGESDDGEDEDDEDDLLQVPEDGEQPGAGYSDDE